MDTSHPLKTLRITENNKQLSVCNEIISLGAIFDSAVFSTKLMVNTVFMLLTAGGSFAENVTVTNMWHFVEGLSQPLAKKKKVKVKLKL